MKYLICFYLILMSFLSFGSSSMLDDSTRISKIEIYAIPFDSHFSKGVTVEDIAERSYIYVDIKGFEQFEFEYGEEISQMVTEEYKEIPYIDRCTGIRLFLIVTQQNGVKHEVFFSNQARTIYNGKHYETNSKFLVLLKSYLPERFD